MRRLALDSLRVDSYSSCLSMCFERQCSAAYVFKINNDDKKENKLVFDTNYNKSLACVLRFYAYRETCQERVGLERMRDFTYKSPVVFSCLKCGKFWRASLIEAF